MKFGSFFKPELVIEITGLPQILESSGILPNVCSLYFLWQVAFIVSSHQIGLFPGNLLLFRLLT